MCNRHFRHLFKIFCLFLSIQCFGQNDKPSTDSVYPSTIKVAGDKSLKGNGFRRFLMGKNYRREWTKPVDVPVLKLKVDFGGLEPKKEGGGKQTKSLQVEDKDGKSWSLRSIEKFPEKAIDPEFRKTIIEKLVKDGISASYPYGVLSTGVLSKAAHVPYLKDTLLYLPDDPLLEKFREKYKNTLVLMEEREPEEVLLKQKDDKEYKTISTEELVYELARNNKNKVDQLAVLRARLLDNFIMDFDRHEGQWNWMVEKTDDGKIFYPIPKDRDQAFYTSQGLLSKFTRGKSLFPELQGFRKRVKNIRTFNKPARNFDRFFLNELTEEDWQKEIDVFLNSMTDSVIEAALNKQPEEIQKYSAKKIIKILKAKRTYFKAEMIKYYEFLSGLVSVVGSNEAEQFTISKNDNGTISVVVNKIDDEGNLSSKLKSYSFNTEITNEIQIYGLEDDDRFVLEGGNTEIKIRLIGGPGEDQFVNNSGNGKVLVYDVKFEENTITGNKKIKNKITNDPKNNNYTRLGYKYYSFISPSISIEYSVDGGFFIGPKLKIKAPGFRKEPYKLNHVIAANRAVNSSSYHIKYIGEFIKIFKKTDLVLSGDLKLPTSRSNYFGSGNNTIFEKGHPGNHQYYLARYDILDFSIQARTSINSWLRYKYGPSFQYFWLKGRENEGKYIAELFATIPDQKTLYERRMYAGGGASIEINTKNSELIPTRGLTLATYVRSLAGLNNFSNNVTETGSEFKFYTDFGSKKYVVLAMSFGASHIFGNYEFEQAQYLGFKQNLRGFRIMRFAGRTRAYNNAELRFKIANLNAFLFRGPFGILAFNDVGRVWADNESSNTWHNGYGGGIWIAPFNKFVVTGSATFSKEEKNLILLTFGFQF